MKLGMLQWPEERVRTPLGYILSLVWPTYRELCLETTVRYTGVGSKPEQHRGSCRPLSRGSSVATQAGDHGSI